MSNRSTRHGRAHERPGGKVAEPSSSDSNRGARPRGRPPGLLVPGLVTAACIVVVVGAAGAMAVVAEGRAGQDRASQPTVPPLLVDARPIARSDGFPVQRRFLGAVEAPRRSSLSFEVAAEVIEVVSDEGDVVARGDLLARLDTQRLRSRLAEVRAEAGEIEANLALAESTAARTRAAFERDTVSRQRLDEANQAAAALRAALARVEASARVLEVDIQKSRMRAPFDARVVHRFLDEGVVVQPGQAILEVVESAGAEVRVGVPVAVASGVEVGVVLGVEASGVIHDARVTAIVADVASSTRTADIILRVEGDARRLFPGTSATLVLDGFNESPSFALPRACLVESARGLWAVYVLTPLVGGEPAEAEVGATHRVVARQVEVLHLAGDTAFVAGGVADGDLVAISGTHRLINGLGVRLWRAGAVSDD